MLAMDITEYRGWLYLVYSYLIDLKDEVHKNFKILETSKQGNSQLMGARFTMITHSFMSGQ